MYLRSLILTYQKNDIVEVQITKIVKYGAFCKCVEDPKTSGLIHISEISADEFVTDIHKYLQEGDILELMVLKHLPAKNQLSLSLKAIRN